ncbi:MAG: PD-(D/E)XK nuclease family protein [Leptolyngbyaceae cyanobacterium]
MVLRQISQSHLTLLDYCPRKFQHLYLEQLGSPASLQEQAALQRGSDLHHLMQQQELQLLLRVDPLPSSWPPETVRLYQMAHRLATAIPSPNAATRFRQSEYRVHYELEGMLLTVVYDLLVLTETHAYIFDWKTYSRPPKQADLAAQWQTKLYPFVLAATSDYAPADITLSYWFVKPPVQQTDGAMEETWETTLEETDLQPACLQFEYGDRLHDQIHHTLGQTISRLKQWLADYDNGHPLPQTDQSQARCPRCPFALRCGRSHPSASGQWLNVGDIGLDEIGLDNIRLDDIEAIAEIPLPD